MDEDSRELVANVFCGLVGIFFFAECIFKAGSFDLLFNDNYLGWYLSIFIGMFLSPISAYLGLCVFGHRCSKMLGLCVASGIGFLLMVICDSFECICAFPPKDLVTLVAAGVSFGLGVIAFQLQRKPQREMNDKHYRLLDRAHGGKRIRHYVVLALWLTALVF